MAIPSGIARLVRLGALAQTRERARARVRATAVHGRVGVSRIRGRHIGRTIPRSSGSEVEAGKVIGDRLQDDMSCLYGVKTGFKLFKYTFWYDAGPVDVGDDHNQERAQFARGSVRAQTA